MGRGRYSKARRLERERHERARRAAAEEGMRTHRWRCPGCGTWLVEIDDEHRLVAINPAAAAALEVDNPREIGPPNDEGLVLIDYEMEQVLEVHLFRCPRCGHRWPTPTRRRTPPT